MDSSDSLVGKVLIAMPTLADPNFWRSVVLLGAHSAGEGAFGLIINRPLDVGVADILHELGEEAPKHRLPHVLAGGPVQPSHGFVLFDVANRPPAEDDLVVGDNLTVSGSSQTLVELAQGRYDGRFLLILGYAGWYPGQLETEIEENSWLVAPVDTSIIFETPFEERWVAALRSIGVEPGTLVDSGATTPS